MSIQPFGPTMGYERQRLDQDGHDWDGRPFSRHGWLYRCPGGCGVRFWEPDDMTTPPEALRQMVVDHFALHHPEYLELLGTRAVSPDAPRP